MERHDYEQHVRKLWAAWERDGIEGLRPLVDDDVQWLPFLGEEPLRGLTALAEYWDGTRGHQSVIVHAWEQHGDCVLVHGSMRRFSDGGFVDVQPSWVYFFRDGRLTRAFAYTSREDALAAIDEYGSST